VLNYTEDDVKEAGYFSSNREGGKGDDDIYYFERLSSEEVECLQEAYGIVREE